MRDGFDIFAGLLAGELLVAAGGSEVGNGDSRALMLGVGVGAAGGLLLGSLIVFGLAPRLGELIHRVEMRRHPGIRRRRCGR